MLGSGVLFMPGIVVVSVAATLQAGVPGAVKTVKMSAKLLAGHPDSPRAVGVPRDPAAPTDMLAPEREETAAASASTPDTRRTR
jgi:hypothetical protein